jgi:beta-lactamase class A
MNSRRHFILSGALASIGLIGGGRRGFAAPSSALEQQFARIELEGGGRLGIAVLDAASGVRAGHRADDLFPMCSTFKLLACGALLKRVDAGEERLDRRVKVEASDIVPDSSVIKAPEGGDGMSIAELCAAAMTYSDNTAANLILAGIGGPSALTAFARSIGDTKTRLDRIEPELNEALPGDPRDTTTPAAMLDDIQKLILGDALSGASRAQLTQWLLDNKTGGKRLRAGLPNGWRCGDKTGSGERGTTNDVGVLWPPGRAPIVVTIYLTETAAPADKRDATLAAVGRAIATAQDSGTRGKGTY